MIFQYCLQNNDYLTFFHILELQTSHLQVSNEPRVTKLMKSWHSLSDFICNIRDGYIDMDYSPENPYFAQKLGIFVILIAQQATV